MMQWVGVTAFPGTQQAPVAGGGHVFGLHVPPDVHETFGGTGQSAAVVWVQVPSAWQHAPVATQLQQTVSVPSMLCVVCVWHTNPLGHVPTHCGAHGAPIGPISMWHSFGPRHAHCSTVQC